ncbi:MAG: PD-(D/E)XK nuclease family protein [Clostridia bacterium]|nr:PD-(D/E)XK nuclease family protein [Clostridia bacterium]
MLRFICGTAETEKLNEIYRRAKADADLGKKVFILVPEQYSMYAESHLIAALGLSCQDKIRVLTFSRLCNLVFSKMGPLRTKYMDKAGKHIMTRRALQLASGDLKFFKRNLHQHGFTSLVQSAISEFKRYGISPHTLLDTAENTADEKLKMKLSDLSAIYEKFNALVEENHSNTEDNLSLVIPKIDDAVFLHGSVFYLNFFRSFTPTEYELLSHIMKNSELCISLSLDNIDTSSILFSSQQNTYRKLSSIAKNCDIDTSTPVFFNNSSAETHFDDLRHLKENFAAFAPSAFSEKPEHIHILRPTDLRAEVCECAQLIRRLLREKDYTFNDILILTGNMENYELLLPRIFDEYEISYFLDRKLPLTESPFMRMIVSVLEILAYGFSYERIMRFARSGYADISAQDTDIFENYVLAADISHTQWNTTDPWTYNPDPFMFDMNTVNSARDKLVQRIRELEKMFSGRKTAKTICDNIYRWLEQMNTPETVAAKINRFKEESRIEDAEQLRLVWNSFVSVTSQLGEYMNDEYTTFTEFLELFTSACGELSVGMVPPTHDKVLVSPVDMFRSTGCKAVIVLGAVDGIFPRDCNSEGLISDAERLVLEKAGLTLAPDSFARQTEEEFLVYSVLTTAKEQLYIFSPLSDREGKGLKPSEVVLTLRDSLFPLIEDESTNGSCELDLTESREAAFRQLSMKLFETNWNITLLPPLWKTVYHNLSEDKHYKKRLQKLQLMHTSDTSGYSLGPEVAKKLYGLPLTLSVSKLEKYNACAFSFFMRYGLLAQERLLGGLNPTDTGNILHNVLCDYFKAKADEKADYSLIDREQCHREISKLVDELAKTTNENLYTASHYYKYMMLRLKSIAVSTAWKLIKFYAQSEFRPTGFEIGFGENKNYPPYELESTEGKVCLKGFIDRVDSAEIDGKSYISITDYKSSERKLDLDLAEAGIHFQPLIYANALAKNAPDTNVAAMFYLQMNDPLISCPDTPTKEKWEKEMNKAIAAHGIISDIPEVIQGIDKSHGNKDAIHYIECNPKSLLAPEHFERLLSDADKKAAETADRILSGEIEVNPAYVSDFDPCRYCPYGIICQKNNPTK